VLGVAQIVMYNAVVFSMVHPQGFPKEEDILNDEAMDVGSVGALSLDFMHGDEDGSEVSDQRLPSPSSQRESLPGMVPSVQAMGPSLRQWPHTMVPG